jgi:predicted nucleotidyltransferase
VPPWAVLRSPLVTALTEGLLALQPQFRIAFPQLRLLVLHGSRARGDAHEGSDWDFAYQADPGFEPLDLWAELSRALGSEAVDLADLNRATGLLRQRAARDGVLLYERRAGAHEQFVVEAVQFWLDIEPIVHASQRAVLEALG